MYVKYYVYVYTRGLRSLCSPAMYLAESLLALRARQAALRARQAALRARRQLQRLFLGLLRASNYLGATDPDVGSRSICSIRTLRLGGEWYTHAGRQAETTSKLIIGYISSFKSNFNT